MPAGAQSSPPEPPEPEPEEPEPDDPEPPLEPPDEPEPPVEPLDEPESLEPGPELLTRSSPPEPEEPEDPEDPDSDDPEDPDEPDDPEDPEPSVDPEPEPDPEPLAQLGSDVCSGSEQRSPEVPDDPEEPEVPDPAPEEGEESSGWFRPWSLPAALACFTASWRITEAGRPGESAWAPKFDEMSSAPTVSASGSRSAAIANDQNLSRFITTP